MSASCVIIAKVGGEDIPELHVLKCSRGFGIPVDDAEKAYDEILIDRL